MRKIRLNNGRFAIVDDKDFDSVNRFAWFVVAHGRRCYARAKDLTRRRSNGERPIIYMHRLILGYPVGDIDHKNGDGLDNQRSNLRVCTRSQNMQNQTTRATSKSGFRGVTWNKTARKWVATIGLKGRIVYLGCFESKEEASLIYENAAQEHFGEFYRQFES
jgi:hypothetical protein